MKIAFSVPRASHLEPGFSGDKIYVPALIDGLRDRGHQVRVVSRMNVRDIWRHRVPVHRVIAELVAVRRNMRRFSPDAWLVFEPAVTNPDLFGWWQHPNRYVLVQARMGGRRVPRRWRWLFAFAQRRSVRRADQITAYEHGGYEQLRHAGVQEYRLHLVPPAVKLWDSTPSQAAARARLTIGSERSVFLCVTRLTEANDRGPGRTQMVFELLAAMSRLSADAMLLIVGGGEGQRRVEERVAALDLGDRVRVAGSVTEEEKRCYYAAADAFVYPNPSDRPFLVVLEAQACGLPVVAMANRCNPFVVQDGRTGLLARDFDELVAHLASLAADRERCCSMGRAAREYVASAHSIETRAREFEELLLGR